MDDYEQWDTSMGCIRIVGTTVLIGVLLWLASAFVEYVHPYLDAFLTY